MSSAPSSAQPRLPRAIWALGFVSMLMDVSSELIHSLLPIYLVTTLGASALSLGFMEGVAEATALISKVFSGTLSDYLGKRKSLALLGYGLSAVTKPLFALAGSVELIFAARFMDRVGKGIRGAPRDALIADITPAEIRGAAYGLRQSLDTVGAFAGPLLATGLMLLWQNQFQRVFWIAVIPAVLATLVLLFGVQEPAQATGKPTKNPIHWQELKTLGSAYWGVAILGAIFTLARFSEAFLVLRAQKSGLETAWVPMIFVSMNVVYALTAYPLGKLSDRMSRKRLLSLGFAILIAADLVLALGQSLVSVFVGIGLWGLHMGATQGILATMVADASPSELRGTAFGVFNLLSGLAMLLASVVAGFLWDQCGPAFTFGAGAVFCLLGLIGMPWLKETTTPST